MTDIKLFRVADSGAGELTPATSAIEKHIQTIFEKHMGELLGVRFLASEYSTGKKHGGRIDSLGIDENNCPVIIEYKRQQNENVINQGLYYLDWLMDHRAEFEQVAVQVMKSPVTVDWSEPRLLCIAGDFTKYDSYAVEQIDRVIELLRYRIYEDNLLLIELVNAVHRSPKPNITHKSQSGATVVKQSPIKRKVSNVGTDLFDLLDKELFSLGDDVQRKELKLYNAYRRIKNFACVVTLKSQLTVYLNIKPMLNHTELTDGFTRDVSTVGHWATGNLEVRIVEPADIERAWPLIKRSYQES